MIAFTQQQMQQIACGALKIERRIGHSCQMAALIYVFNAMGPNLSCEQIEEGAQTMACLERQEQLPALIFLAAQILFTAAIGPQGPQGATGGPGPAGPPGPVLTFSGNYGGNPPPFTPAVAAGQLAIAYDNSTNQPWYWVLGAWQN